jgi:broad specificity phosphatase PhoE
MKKIYFVRHGESEGNIGPVTQEASSPLSANGKLQARKIADRLKNLNFDLLVASPHTRTYQTAEIISVKTKKPILVSELFIERRRPSEQDFVRKDDPAKLASDQAYYEAFRKGELYKDGEGFAEIFGRAKKCLQYLNSIPEERIVVVTHGVFMKVICATVILGDVINAENCNAFLKNVDTTNTGITMIEHDVDWRLVVWNDSAHFAEY